MQKFSKIDKVFIENRNAFFESNHSINAKFAVDNWPLLAGHVPIAVFLARYEIFKATVDVPGHVMEFGVFNGSNLLFLAKMLDLFAPHSLKCVYGFDAFLGLTEFSDEDLDATARAGDYKGDSNLLREMIEMHCLEDRCTLVEGLIEKTLPEFIDKNRHIPLSYVYIDTDLYASTKIILELCWGRLSTGGRIAFDEGYHDEFQGEGVALQEFLQEIPGEYISGNISFSRQPMIWIEKR